MTLERRTPLRAKPRSKGNRCACGCGAEIPEVSKNGNPQRYVQGHNGRKSLESLVVAEDRGYETLCLIWQGGQTGNGHGRTKWKGRMVPAHRAFFEAAGGVVLDGEELGHLCGVRLCVQPTHLEAVTPTENKRRSRSTKLTSEQVEEIRAARQRALDANPLTADGRPRQRVADGVELRRQLAAKYGVTPDMIKHIWRGASWR